jgi:hypothetical protein
VGRFGLHSSGSGYGQVACSFETGNEPSGSIKGGEFLTNWTTISFSRRALFHVVNYFVGWLFSWRYF